ncbi:hypothetical protein CGJ66_11440 [Vibrio parahaemolyticus]|nr:hypothetical protein CGJ66_11440 [Vibrio parahaemolyticus]
MFSIPSLLVVHYPYIPRYLNALAHNAFYTANSGLFRTLPPSFLTKEKQILALIFMKKIEK